MENVLNEFICPIDIEWKLNEVDLMELTQGGYLDGEYFSANNIAGILYSLQIFPDGFCEDTLGRTWIFFNIAGLGEAKITSEFVVSVESANFSETYDFVREIDMKHEMDICGSSEFFDTKNKYFVNGEITIKIKGFFKAQRCLSSEIVCPIETEWKFKKADFMDLMDSENKSLKGKYFYAFNIPGLRYNVKIYPNGDNEKHRGKTWIFFHTKVLKDRNITADLKIIIESANVSESLKYVFKDKTRKGAKICKMNEFFDSKSKYFLDGEITIKVIGIFKTSICSNSRVCSQLSMQWKIKEADIKEVVEEESNGGILRSTVVKIASLSDVRYYLEIYTNVEKKITIFFCLNVDRVIDKKIKADLDLSVKTANFNHSFTSTQSFGLGTFICSTKDLFNPSKGFIVNGYLTVKLDGIFIKESYHYITLTCNNGVSSKFAFEMDVKDYLIVVGEKEIQVHKQLLMEISPVFAEMFESGTKEFITEDKIIITNFAFKIVEAAIKLCYGVNVSLIYSLENLLSLYKFGHEYRISLIMDSIEEYLIKEISPSNVVYLIKFSSLDSFNVKKLYQSCIAFLIKCSKESDPIYASESLGEQFLASMVLNTFSSKC